MGDFPFTAIVAALLMSSAVFLFFAGYSTAPIFTTGFAQTRNMTETLAQNFANTTQSNVNEQGGIIGQFIDITGMLVWGAYKGITTLGSLPLVFSTFFSEFFIAVGIPMPGVVSYVLGVILTLIGLAIVIVLINIIRSMPGIT